MGKVLQQKVLAVFSEHHRYTVNFEAAIEESGYVLISIPTHTWQEMGEPRSLVVTYEPKSLSPDAKSLTFSPKVEA